MTFHSCRQRTCSFMLRAALALLSDLCSCIGRIKLLLPALHYASTAMEVLLAALLLSYCLRDMQSHYL